MQISNKISTSWWCEINNVNLSMLAKTFYLCV